MPPTRAAPHASRPPGPSGSDEAFLVPLRTLRSASDRKTIKLQRRNA